MPEIEQIQAISGLVDSLSTFVVMVFMIIYLMRKLAVLETMLYGDWQRQREEEIEQRLKSRMAKEFTSGV